VGAFVLGLFAAALGALLLWLLLRLRVESVARARARASYFDEARALLTAVRRGAAPTGFARLDGRRGGLRIDLQAVPDTLALRKLPALWVLVTIPQPMPLAATADLLLRPGGLETFSRWSALPRPVAPPSGFPEGLAIRTDDPSGRIPEALLRRHLHLLAHPRAKELVLSPKGLRLVILAEEAERGPYLLFRAAELGRAPLAAEALRPHLDGLVALAGDLVAGDRAA
jgi:hypothetical protein